ncbi:MAG: stage III sporulation protein AF [Lachnospiraceae bacterium]|nr:stage III sporulation protein AF [Lachnospiraceae bacterium]
MGTVLSMLQRVSIFILAASLVTNLFAETEYKKYFQYATGLIIIALVATPLLALSGEENDLGSWVKKGVFDEKTKEMEEHIRMLGKEYEKSVSEQYERQIRKDVAAECGTEEENCEVKIANNRIEWIRVWVDRMPENVTACIRQLAIRYGVDENNILIQEGKREWKK